MRYLSKTNVLMLTALLGTNATAQGAKFGVFAHWTSTTDTRNADGLAMQLKAVGAQYLLADGPNYAANYAGLSAALAARNILLRELLRGTSEPALIMAGEPSEPSEKDKAPARYTVEETVAMSLKATAEGKPVTWDVPLQPNGMIAGPYLAAC
jgi:hypothetical protein